ncbi:MAG: hypothetical protein KDD60_11695, partial [Bdellovibrionales bacterium]|nr:hypothetical protein [Bdellovibrionales bacterium]
MDVSLIGLREHPEQGIATISSFLDEVDTVFHELNTYLSEATQNRLRNYFKVLTLNPEHSEQFNPLIQRTTKALQEALRRERQNLVEVSFEELTAEYSEQELHLIGQEISVIQLTVGCSVGCPSCSPMALTGVRRILSWDAIQEICLNWTESLSKNNVFFHWSSDSGDWKDSSGKTFRDVIQLLAEKYNYFPEITSAIPKGYEDEFKDLWSSVENQMRFSASNINLQRVLGEVPSREGISTSD